MGETASSGDSYYNEPVFYGQQPEDGGLTQHDIDELSARLHDCPEVSEHDPLQYRLEFIKYLRENGHFQEGEPDPNEPPLMHKEVRHAGNLYYMARFPAVYFDKPDPDLPPAA